MRIVSNGSFDPLCPSPLVVANAHTMQPRPTLFRQIIKGSLDNGGMHCEPCVQADPPRPGYSCFCSCYSVSLPQLFTGSGGIFMDPVYPTACDELQALTAPKTVILSNDGVLVTDRTVLGYIPGGLPQCSNYPSDFGCLWGGGEVYGGAVPAHLGGSTDYQAYYLHSPMMPEVGGPISAGFWICFERPKSSGFGGELWEIFAAYSCSDFTASGGIFTYDAAHSSTMCGVVGDYCTIEMPECHLPDTLSIVGVACP